MSHQTVIMTDRQKVAIGVSILDQDGQPFSVLPAGIAITFTSDNPAVAAVTVRPDGLNADIVSGLVGQATITVEASGDLVLSDTVAIEVQNSAPGSLNLTVGAPEDE